MLGLVNLGGMKLFTDRRRGSTRRHAVNSEPPPSSVRLCNDSYPSIQGVRALVA
jgi:hypothetical protein